MKVCKVWSYKAFHKRRNMIATHLHARCNRRPGLHWCIRVGGGGEVTRLVEVAEAVLVEVPSVAVSEGDLPWNRLFICVNRLFKCVKSF